LYPLDTHKKITQYKLDNWQAERGLTQISVRVLRQTRNGYIWLGTKRGLVRFDGNRFVAFNKENTRGLADNFIKALMEDRSGTLWIGTSTGGLSYLKDETFFTYSSERYSDLKEITALFEDHDGGLWIGTLNNGLTLLKNGLFHTFTTKDGLPVNRIHTIQEDNNGRLFIGTSVGLSVRTESGIFENFPDKSTPLYKHIFTMFKSTKGKLWMGCDDGIYFLKNHRLIPYPIPGERSHHKVMSLYEDQEENLWIGLDGEGLARIRNNNFEIYKPGDGLACGFIYSILEDMEGSIWFGSLSGGLHRLSDRTITTYTTKEGLSHDISTRLFEDKNGNIWIGTQGGGLNLLKDKDTIVEFIKWKGLLSDYVYSVTEDANGTIWAGTAKGLNRIKNGIVSTFPLPPPEANRPQLVYDLIEDKDGGLWIMTLSNVYRYKDGNLSEQVNIKTTQKPFSSICIGPNGNTWIGTYGSGLIRINDGDLTIFTTRNGLAHNEIECLYTSDEKKLYIGTRGGLSRFQKGKFINVNTNNGLVDNYIRAILQDDNGHLWLGSRIGISRIDKEDLAKYTRGETNRISPVTFDETDGLKSARCNRNGIKTRDGKLWFSTTKGVAVIDPDNIKKYRLPPPVRIEEVRVDGEKIPINPNNKPIEIPPRAKRVEFFYTGISFLKPGKIRFKLKLKGYESRWHDAGYTRSTVYTRLSPGNYTFKVIASNSDGIWNYDGDSFKFIMLPSFYQTTMFYILAILTAVVLIFSLYRYRLKQLRTKERELTTLVELRTADLKVRNMELETAHQNIQNTKELIEAKNLQLEEQSEKLKDLDQVKSRFFANISHEFRTPLTLIMGPLEQVYNENRDRKLAGDVRLALRNSQRLLNLINQLLDLSKLESGKMQLQTALQDAIPFLKGLVGAFKSLAEQKKLEINFNSTCSSLILYFDMEKLERVICNLLLNAVKFTPEGGKITVTATGHSDAAEHFPDGYLEIIVNDSGIGIPAQQLPYIFNRFYRASGTETTQYKENGTGIGLALVKELITIHHGTIDVASKNTGNSGTTFTLRIPLGRQHLRPNEISAKNGTDHRSAQTVEEIQSTSFDIESKNLHKNGTAEKTSSTDDKDKEKNVILVVDDNPDVRKFIRDPLETDYIVVEAINGNEGLTIAGEIIPDLIISDVMMPEKDGIQFSREIKSDIKTSHIPIILLTARASDENVIQGLESGADDYITKPFNTKILLARIKNLIDLRRGLQEKVQKSMMLQPSEIKVSNIDEDFMKELLTVIEANISDQDFGVDQLAKKLLMSRATLNRKIRALTGESTNKFIQSYRLKRSIQLLKANFGNVTEVAFEVGFSNAAYFTKCFKEKFQQLPTTYLTTENS
jgi:signal transduction histidine kinase/ligand-binding sensor domain-containing protein/DNA-binding response OmpR family regulator